MRCVLSRDVYRWFAEAASAEWLAICDFTGRSTEQPQCRRKHPQRKCKYFLYHQGGDVFDGKRDVTKVDIVLL
jgi:hypothetical protein